MSKVPPKAAVLAAQMSIEAMDHPLRQAILALLFQEKGEMAYNDIALALGKRDNSAIAHHLKVLVGAALVGNHLRRVDGRIKSLYFISDEGAEWLEKTGLGTAERVRVLLKA